MEPAPIPTDGTSARRFDRRRSRPFRQKLDRLLGRLARMGIGLEVSEAAMAEVSKAGFDPDFGARPLKRAVVDLLENPLSKALLEGTCDPGRLRRTTAGLRQALTAGGRP